METTPARAMNEPAPRTRADEQGGSVAQETIPTKASTDEPAKSRCLRRYFFPVIRGFAIAYLLFEVLSRKPGVWDQIEGSNNPQIEFLALPAA